MRLAYSNEAEGLLDRLYRKAGELETKLLGDRRRPKGIHLITYQRITVQLDTVEKWVDGAFLARVLARCPHLAFEIAAVSKPDSKSIVVWQLCL